MSRWVVVGENKVRILQAPDLGAETDEYLRPGKEFEVEDEVTEGNRLFLRMADGRFVSERSRKGIQKRQHHLSPRSLPLPRECRVQRRLELLFQKRGCCAQPCLATLSHPQNVQLQRVSRGATIWEDQNLLLRLRGCCQEVHRMQACVADRPEPPLLVPYTNERQMPNEASHQASCMAKGGNHHL